MLSPANESELATLLTERDAPVQVQGGGTRGLAGSGAEVLSTAALTGVTLYESGALTMVARAGTPLAEIEATLAQDNQRLPFEPWDARRLMGREGTPTIGGAVAANASDPRRVQAGACRDSLIGVRFVDGRGTVVKNGGRVMKNVTGYDLVKLMAGSHGTLGVLTEVSFKVLPAVEKVATLMLAGLDNDAAIGALTAALRSPFEVSGAAHLPKGGDGSGLTMMRLEGFTDSVAYRAGRLTDLLAPFGAVTVETDMAAAKAQWADIRDVALFAGTSGDIWRISVKPSDGPEAARRVGGDVMFDWGGGLVWAQVAPGTDLRAKLGDLPGHATLVRGDALGRAVFHPEPAPLAALSAGLRAKFDPRGLLNPGLMATATG